MPDAPIVATLGSIGSGLATIIERADAAEVALGKAVKKAQEHGQAVADAVAESEGLAEEVEAQQTRILAKLGGTSTRLKALRQEVERETAELERRQADQLDSLLQRVQQFQGAWAEEIERAIEAVNAGAVSVQEFLRLWGDAQVQTEEGSRKISRLLQDLDLRSRQNELQALVKALQQGVVDVGEAAAKLAESGFEVAQQLQQAVDLFQQGQGSLERVIQLSQAIRRQFGDSDLAHVADAIVDELRTGARRGQV